MRSTLRLDIGLSFLLRCASPLVTDRDTELIVVAPSDRTTIAGAAPTARTRNLPNPLGHLAELLARFGVTPVGPPLDV